MGKKRMWSPSNSYIFSPQTAPSLTSQLLLIKQPTFQSSSASTFGVILNTSLPHPLYPSMHQIQRTPHIQYVRNFAFLSITSAMTQLGFSLRVQLPNASQFFLSRGPTAQHKAQFQVTFSAPSSPPLSSKLSEQSLPWHFRYITGQFSSRLTILKLHFSAVS